ncbi:MAG: EF-hand domain-containing protein [Candidatus Latescibacterota bacterium]|nr:EF-hand domain-containing protein [Candidatus Latescibacterota bacterium]
MSRFILALSLIGMASASTIAQPPPPPEIVLAPPPGTKLPPPAGDDHSGDPERAKIMIFDHLFALMDTDGDGRISKEEMLAWLKGVHFGHGPMGGVSEGDEGLEGLLYPDECSAATVTSEMTPQDTNVACSGSESEGNLLHRTVCNMAPYDSQAISVPEGRAVDCFAIAAIKGHNIEFEIIKESDGSQMYHTSMGKATYDTLVLTGEPGGTVYRIKLLSADETDARITLEFIDHPTF